MTRKLRHYEAVPEPGEGARIALYLRYSSDNQSASTIAKQRMVCGEFIARKNWQVIIEYEEPAQTAKDDDIERRPRFSALLDAATRHEFDAVVVESIDRWARAEAAQFVSLGILRNAGVYWATGDGLWNSRTIREPGWSLAFMVGVGEASSMSRTLSKKVFDGKRSKAEDGYHNGNPPFGYKWADPVYERGKIRRRELLPDPATFPALAIIAEMRLAGHGAKDIADELNRRGYRHPYYAKGRTYTLVGGTSAPQAGANRPLQFSTITHILSNRFYVESIPGSGKGSVIANRPDGTKHWVPGRHPATWDWETWERMQAITKRLAHAPHATERYRYAYPFAGILVCAVCGILTRCQRKHKYDLNKVYQYYICAARNNKRHPGRNHTRCEIVEDAFGALFSEHRLGASWLEDLKSFLDEATAPAMEIDERRAALEREIADLNLMLRVRTITPEQFEREAQRLVAERDRLPHTTAHQQQQHLIQATARIADLATVWSAAPQEQRREMVQLLMEPTGLVWDHDQQQIIAVKPFSEFHPGFALALPAWQRREGWLIVPGSSWVADRVMA